VPTQAELVTPERVLFSGEADQVVLRTDGGEIMFLPNHAPFVGALDVTVLRIAPAGSVGGPGEGDGGHGGSGAGTGSGAGSSGEFRAAVHGGFVHVANNKVTVLASVAEAADEIDVDRARRALEAAKAAGGEGAGERRAAAETERAGADLGAQAEAHEGEQVEQSSAMKAMLYPDDPEVALRRAEVRLEAAGVEVSGGGAG
jgi:F-type H+-transporting ATPase subunit epsilon